MRATRRIVAGGLGLGLVLGAVTLLALEGGEVVVLRTRAADGGTRDTRAWIADDADGAWVEAASPERPFVRDATATPAIELRRRGRWQRCRATVTANPAGHERIRALLAEKYGWKDRWIGRLADTRRSLALRLDCEAA